MSCSWITRITSRKSPGLSRTGSTLKVGIIGCGAIGSAMAKAIQRPPLSAALTVAGLCDLDQQKARGLAQRLRGHVPVLPVGLVIQRAEIVVEATSAAASAAIVAQALAARRTVLAMSIGGLLPVAHRFDQWTRRGGRLVLPSGAIAGLDAVKAARLGRLRSVTLTTRKPPASLIGAPGLLRRPLTGLRRPLTVFSGSAARAVKGFPQNINVAATLSLAGFGARRTRVRIIADPRVRTNIHEIQITGRFGRVTVRTDNRPSPVNPKTSELAILSALATLQQLASPWRVGT